MVLDVYLDVLARHQGVAVVMDGSRLLAMDGDALRAEGLDLRVVAKGLHEEICGNLRRIKGIEGFHDNHVHLTVLHRGTWGDIGIVAVLRGIGTGNEEGLVTLGTLFVLHLVGFGLVLQTLLQHVLHISDRATLASLRELQRYEGIEAHAAGAEERQVVDNAIVERLYLIGIDDLNGLLDVEWETEMTGESVARATRNDAQGRGSVRQ